MKIYINNFNLDIIKDIDNLFKEYLVGAENYLDLYTDEGIYRIENKNIYILEPIDRDIKIYENYYNNFSLIFDPSYFNKYSVSSIQGHTHLSFQTTNLYYKLNKNSSIKMVCKYISKNGKQTPNDIYFETEKNNLDINDYKNDLIEFLSVLN